MCGILAVLMLDGRPVEAERLVAMRDTMLHRGPDAVGLHLDGPAGLAHRRLSIIDLSPAGHQPMRNEDGTVWLVFNGEIYNYVELAEGLRARGHRFHSGSDAEVIVHLWEEHGERVVDHLNGMFGFVIWDSRRRELFGARDRAGIKPLQYYLGPDRFIAASEIKAILADPEVPRQPDPEGLSDMLLAGFPLGEKTCFAGIRQVLPGHAFSLCDGRLRTWSYWDLEFDYDHARPVAQTVEQLTHLLDDAVRIRCRSDAPLGCHLSGGLDSSTVAALTARHVQPLKTFSIRFPGGGIFDESAFARSAAAHVGSEHHETMPGPDRLARLLPALAWHSDHPMPGISSFSYYTAAHLASRHVKVALTGHGGDEIFAGYPAQFEAAFGDTSMFDLSSRPREQAPLVTRARLSIRRHGLLGTLRRSLGNGVHPPPDDLAAQWMRLHCSYPPLESPLLTPGFRRALGGYDSRVAYLEPLTRAPTDEVLDRCLYHDLRCYLPGLLHQEDRSSMAVSLESRVPLLDYRVLEFLATVPPAQKVEGHQPKALLRRVAAGRLPQAVIQRRDKGAFRVPLHRWFGHELRPLVEEVLFSRAARDRGIFDPVELRGAAHEGAALWGPLAIELWFRLFIDQDPEWLARARAPLSA